jgi:glucose-6-phosphate dehydrogenase assembly protein OpcA
VRRQIERSEWSGRGVHTDDLAVELGKLHRVYQGHAHAHALARTLNLIVMPSGPDCERVVSDNLATLGAHSPSRTIELREHGADRLDAELVIESEVPETTGTVGVAHDRVLLAADRSRLEHADSLLAALLVNDLPTVLWLPDAGVPIPDPRLLERADHLLVDSSRGDAAVIRTLAELVRATEVHDLAWGGLEFWRAATAAAFDPPERRALLPQISGLELRYEGDAFESGLLLAGWIGARAGWRSRGGERENGRLRAEAARADGGAVSLTLEPDPQARGCGGIEELKLRAGSEEVRIGRGAATHRLRDLFAEALRPLPSFAHGYPEAVGEAESLLDGSSPGA